MVKFIPLLLFCILTIGGPFMVDKFKTKQNVYIFGYGIGTINLFFFQTFLYLGGS